MTTAIIGRNVRNVQGQTTIPANPAAAASIVLPLLPLNGSWSVKGRISANTGDGTASAQSWEINISGGVAAGTSNSTAAVGSPLLTPAAPANSLANAAIAVVGVGAAGRQIEVTFANGGAASGTVTFWSWNLTVERCAFG
jgi:hypothetical protein